MDAKKEKFLKIFFSDAGDGNVSRTCQMCQITRKTFYNWKDEDPEFSSVLSEWEEMDLDNGEEELRKRRREGDTAALIFFLKTKGRKRGYVEKDPPAPVPVPVPVEPAPVGGQARMEIARKIENKKRYMVKLLKKEGKYTAELSMQVTLTAQLLVKVDTLAAEIFSDGHSSITVEYSREGNERQSISAKEKLYLDYVEQAWKALRALGMNTDAKERRTDGPDTFADFLGALNEDAK